MTNQEVNVVPPEFPPEDPTMARTPITSRSDHVALGLTLRVESNDSRIHHAAASTFGPDVEHDDDGQLDIQMRLFVHPVDEAPGFRPRQPLVRSHGDDFWIAASRSSVVSGNSRVGSIFGFVSETVANHADYVGTAFVQSAFLLAAQRHSIVAIHSACLARGHRAIMLRGDSGSGKSTLAYAALRRGFSLVAEDVVFLRTHGQSPDGRLQPYDIELHGLPWNLHLLPDAATFFPELTGVTPHERSDGRLKLALSIAERFPGQTAPSAPLGPLVFVERAGRPVPRLTTLSRLDALTRLAATAIHYERDANTRYGLWDAFLSQPVYLLETADDPDRNAAVLERVIETTERQG